MAWIAPFIHKIIHKLGEKGGYISAKFCIINVQNLYINIQI